MRERQAPRTPQAALPQAAREAVTDAGVSLPAGVREPMERSFGHDFGAVRVHTDARATNALHANAFTVGDHIVMGPGAPHDVLGHELAHVVQQRSGGGSGAAVERDAVAAGANAHAGHRAVVAAHGGPPAVLFQRRTFGAGSVLVAVENGVVTVNGQTVKAAVAADGRLTYNGREIVLDRSGVFRYRDRYTVCMPCNPDYYTGPPWRTRAGTAIPDAVGSFYDPARSSWVQRSEPVVSQARITSSTPAPPGAVDPALQGRVEFAQAAREQFEARVQRAMANGMQRPEAEALVRQRMQESTGERGLGIFETGQTYAVVEQDVGNGVVRRSTTGATQGGEVPTVAVPSVRLQARLTEINTGLGENFVWNEQSLNHAEVRSIVRTPTADVFYVDREMCSMCQRFFLLEARFQGRAITVVDPAMTRVFTPSWEIVEYHPTTVHTRRVAVVREAGVSRLEIGANPSVVHRVQPRVRTGPAPEGLGGQVSPTVESGTPKPAPESGGTPKTTPESGGAPKTTPKTAPEGSGTPKPAPAVETGTPKPVPAVETGTPVPAKPAVPAVGETATKPLGPGGGAIRPRVGGRIRRFAVGAAGRLAMEAVSIVLLLLDVVIQLIIVPYLEKLQRQLEEEHRKRLQEEIQKYYDSYLSGQVESKILGAANTIKFYEDRDEQPYVNTTVTVHFRRPWNFLTGQGYGRPESVLDLEFDRLEMGTVEISSTPVKESAEEMIAEDASFLFGDSWATKFKQTIHFPAIPPTYQDLVNQYGADPAAQGCFIATACYGSWAAPQVETLRRFRDRRLIPHRPGRAFVRWYYRTSPPVADLLWRHPVARHAVRLLVVAPLAATVRALRLDR